MAKQRNGHGNGGGNMTMSPRAKHSSSNKAINLMNALLSIAIVLQLVQIYRTTPNTTGTDLVSGGGIPLPSSQQRQQQQQAKTPQETATAFYNNLRRSLELEEYKKPPGQYQDRYENQAQQNYVAQNLNARPDFVPQVRVQQPYDDVQVERQEILQVQAMDRDAVRRHQNFILYGNEEGPTGKNNEIQRVPRNDDDKTDNNNNDLPGLAKTVTDGFEDPFFHSKFNYSIPATPTTFNLPTQPKPLFSCNKNESEAFDGHVNLAVIVLSRRSNFERRQVIRETWAKGHNTVYFIVGGPQPNDLEDMDLKNASSTSRRVFQEQETYGDLLDTIAPDSYKGLPYKLHYAIQWVARQQCSPPPQQKQNYATRFEWILKVDDDVVVRLQTLQYYILRKFNPVTPIVIGRMEPNSKVHRTGKWAEDPKWVDEEYPPWAYGSTGYVMSRAVMDYVASQFYQTDDKGDSASASARRQQHGLYYYQGEDTSLGIWLFESPLDVTWIDSPDFSIETSKWYNHKFTAVIGHDLKPKVMREMFTKWKDEPPTTLRFHHVNHTKVKGLIFLETQKIAFDYDPNFNYFYGDPEGANAADAAAATDDGLGGGNIHRAEQEDFMNDAYMKPK